MQKYALNAYNTGARHAGGKARNDFSRILVDDGWEEFHINQGNNPLAKVLNRAQALTRLYLAPRDSIFCVQFPTYGKWSKFFIKRAISRFRSIAIIHDIDSIRGEGPRSAEDILCDFDICIPTGALDGVSPAGARFLPDVRVSMIDYLVDPACPSPEWSPRGKALFAGRLSPGKAGWIYDPSRTELPLLLYGIEFEEASANPIDSYAGSFDPSRPIISEPVGWGLIWDGDSLDTCSGPMGEYQRHNHPHKLSLYLALGLPVIIWKEAAAAKFVTENNVGIAVSSLHEATRRIAELSDGELAAMRNNALAVQADVRSGGYLKAAIEKALAAFPQR